LRDFDYIAELVNRVKQDDLLAMKVLYNEFAREMLTASHRITQNLSDAEDIIQESFMTSFEKINKLNEPKNYGAWLKRIVINNSLHLIKKQVHFEEVSSISSEAPDEVVGEMPCLIIKNYRVETWSKDSIKHVVKIEVTPEQNNAKPANDLLDNLQISIPQKNSKTYTVDGNMNIKKMQLINGFFRRDRNTFILDNDKKYNVRQLVINSTFYLPRQSNILLNTDYVGLYLEDLDGQLTINTKYGYIEANNVKEVTGNIKNFNASFKNVEKMMLNASHSSISAVSVKHLQIGSLELLSQRKTTTGLFDNNIPNNVLSFSNKYRIENIEQLNISSTSNDAFTLGTIDHFKAINSNFSNYHIKKIKHSFSADGKNGDVTIYDVAPNFEKINIGNQFSTIDLNMKSVKNFKVNIASKDKTELRFANYLIEAPTKTGWSSNYYKGDKNSKGTVEIDCEYCEVIIN